jgi:hypothetical protein
MQPSSAWNFALIPCIVALLALWYGHADRQFRRDGINRAGGAFLIF